MSARDADQGQPSLRRPATFTDQHGRKWHGQVEKSTGYPVGQIHPLGWHAPFIPPQGTDTFKYSADDPTKFTINYEFLLDERHRAIEQLDKDRELAAVNRGWAPDDPEKQEALDKICGRRDAVKRPEIIVACLKNDAYMLGFSNTPSRWAAFLPKAVDRKSALVSKYDLGGEADALLDVEEEVDPDAVGGKVVPPKPTKTPKRAKAQAA